MIQGTHHPDFQPVARLLRRVARDPAAGGAAICVYHRGEPVVDLWAGSSDPRGGRWQAETMAMSFSTTKGVVSTALHLLVERGALEYDEPVARYWPEFAQAGKERITVRQLLCHEAGLYPIRPIIDHAERMLDWDHMVDALARSRPAFHPGSANGYHGLTYGYLVGELIRRASGVSVGEYVRREIAEPLGLDGFYIGVPKDQLDQVAEFQAPPGLGNVNGRAGEVVRNIFSFVPLLPLLVSPDRIADALMPRGIEEVLFAREALLAEIPAANGVFTARSLARMYALLARGGELDGVRLLSPDTIHLATRIQNRRIDRVVPFPMRWRLGYHMVASTRGVLSRAFGHFGYGGSGAWADPSRDLAVAFVNNGSGGTPFGDLRLLRMNAAAVRCADARR